MTDQVSPKAAADDASMQVGSLGGNDVPQPTVLTAMPEPEKQYLGPVKKFMHSGDRFLISEEAALVEIRIVSDGIFRVRLAPTGEFADDFSYALSKTKTKAKRIEWKEEEEHYSISTPSVICRIRKKDFFISFLDSSGRLMNEDGKAMHWKENTQYGGYDVFASKCIQEKERFYGLGDKPMNLDLHGKQVQNWGTDAYAFKRDTDPLYKNIPFYIGRHDGGCYGIFFDNSFRTTFDFAHEDKSLARFGADGGELNYYYIHGPSMTDVVKQYGLITGTHPMPPKWALGFHISRWSYYPESTVRELAAGFRRRKIPCDCIHLDIDYMDGFRCFTWDAGRFPNPDKMIGDLEAQGFKVVAIIDPGIKVDDDYPVFKEGKKKGYFCLRGDNDPMEGNVWPGRCRFPDFTSPAVRRWWGRLFRRLTEQGVRGIWCDMNEPAVFGTGTFPLDVRHDYDGHNGSHRKAHNVYGMQMARSTYNGLKKLRPDRRPFTITRSGYSGMQRYASTWTGDNEATWEHLKLAVLMLQRLNLSGVSFCGSDIGGFTGDPDGELYVRWIQFGVFSPFMRVHSAGNTRRREPWTFGARFERIARTFIGLRYKLLPYFYSVFREHSRYGLPVMRPLILTENHRTGREIPDDIFTYGEHLLVAPVTEQAARAKKVYFPSGLWYDYWTSGKQEGGLSREVEAPLNSMPLYVRGGSVLPEQPVMQYTDEAKPDQLQLNVYYAPHTVTSLLYEDHGDTFAHEQGIYLEKKFSASGNENSFVIEQEEEGQFIPQYDTYRIRVHGLPFSSFNVLADGKAISKVKRAKKKNTVFLEIHRRFKKIEFHSRVE